MTGSTITRTEKKRPSTPVVPSTRGEVQAMTVARRNALALDVSVAAAGIDNFNQLLADTLTLRDLYKKCHWQMTGPNFYSLHLLFDKHAGEQTALADSLAERVQALGGVCLATGADVAEVTLIPRAPSGREDVMNQLARLLHAHEVILVEARAMAADAAKRGDVGTNDLIVSGIVRLNEMQAWFVAEHLQQATPNYSTNAKEQR
jgi:starvation-inducible DNA-binding protein